MKIERAIQAWEYRKMARITLKGVDPIETVKKYNEGAFRSLSLSSISVKDEEIRKKLRCQGKGLSTARENFKDKVGSSRVVISKPSYNRKTTRCLHCTFDFDWEPVGNLLSYSNFSVNENGEIGHFHKFTMGDTDFCCDFECQLALTQNEKSKRCLYRRSDFANSEVMLRLLYSLLYPDEGELRPAMDKRLYDLNNGHLTRDEYKSHSHIYNKRPNVEIEKKGSVYIASQNLHCKIKENVVLWNGYPQDDPAYSLP